MQSRLKEPHRPAIVRRRNDLQGEELVRICTRIYGTPGKTGRAGSR